MSARDYGRNPAQPRDSGNECMPNIAHTMQEEDTE